MKTKIGLLNILFVFTFFVILLPSKTHAQFGYGVDLKASTESLDVLYTAPFSFPQGFSLEGGGDKGTINLFIPILPPILYFSLGSVDITHNGLLTEELQGIDAAIGGSFLFGLIPFPDMPVPIPFGNYVAEITPLGLIKKAIEDVDKTEGITISMLLTGSNAEIDVYVEFPFVETLDGKFTADESNPLITIPIVIPLEFDIPDMEVPDDIEIPEIEPIEIDINIAFEFAPILSTANITIDTKTESEEVQEPSVPISIPIPNGAYYVKLNPEIIEPEGSLQVVLWPKELRSEAKWRVVGKSNWLNSGDVLENLEKGIYEIEFSEISGWITPDNINVIVSAGQDVSADGFYSKTQPPVDPEGYTYKTIIIGQQEWMAENLRTTKYSDGSAIENAVDSSAWQNNTEGAYSWYNNRIDNKENYGALYNWHAVNNPKGLCPPGWSVPSDEDWQELSVFLGGDDVAGDKLKEKGTAHWAKPNTGTNESGFAARGGGFRPENGIFPQISIKRFIGQFWSSTADGNNAALNRVLVSSLSNFASNSESKQTGSSVRCIKE